MNRQKKILLVTFDNELVSFFKKALNRYDVELTTSETYNEALNLAQENHYDLIVTELFILSEGVQESSDSYWVEKDTLDNDIRLLTPLKDNLIKFKCYIEKKAKEMVFPLGGRLSIETSLMMQNTILLLNIQEFCFDREEFAGYLDSIAIYYAKRGNHVFYPSLGYFSQCIVQKFVDEDIVQITKCEKIY